MIKKGLKLVYWFHGHICPMSTLGYRAGTLAKKLLKINRKDYHKVTVKVFFKSCAIDGIQVSFPATFANGNLILIDEGKFYFEFVDNFKKRAVDITFNQPLIEVMERYRNVRNSESDEKKIKKIFKQFITYTQSAKNDELFVVRERSLK